MTPTCGQMLLSTRITTVFAGMPDGYATPVYLVDVVEMLIVMKFDVAAR